MVAAPMEVGCATLQCEDLQHGRAFIRKPNAAEFDALSWTMFADQG
jgi:hypothetical protein